MNIMPISIEFFGLNFFQQHVGVSSFLLTVWSYGYISLWNFLSLVCCLQRTNMLDFLLIMMLDVATTDKSIKKLFFKKKNLIAIPYVWEPTNQQINIWVI